MKVLPYLLTSWTSDLFSKPSSNGEKCSCSLPLFTLWATQFSWCLESQRYKVGTLTGRKRRESKKEFEQMVGRTSSDEPAATTSWSDGVRCDLWAQHLTREVNQFPSRNECQNDDRLLGRENSPWLALLKMLTTFTSLNMSLRTNWIKNYFFSFLRCIQNKPSESLRF